MFSKVYDHSDGVDGYVSVEVAPDLAHDGPGTEAAARELHERIDRRNLMVKIPGTEEGLAPIQQMIAEGRNINVTLIFSLPRYAQVIEAYIAGLEQLADGPRRRPVPGRERRQLLHQPRRRRGRQATRGRSAPTRRWRCAARPPSPRASSPTSCSTETFSGRRWEALAARGARVQRPLWASTGAKNPDYSDTLYVDELIGPDTVNTLPDATLEAFVDHGTRRPPCRRRRRRRRGGVGGARPRSASTWTTWPTSSSAKASPASPRPSTS